MFNSSLLISASLLTNIEEELQLRTALARVVLPVVLSNLHKLDQKQQDYGSQNLFKFGSYGVVVRTSDKLERLVTLMDKRRHLLAVHPPGSTVAVANNESLEDSFLDLSNYGLIGYVLETGRFTRSS